jgi:hypothetical protein
MGMPRESTRGPWEPCIDMSQPRAFGASQWPCTRRCRFIECVRCSSGQQKLAIRQRAARIRTPHLCPPWLGRQSAAVERMPAASRVTVFDARPPGLHTVKVLMVLLVLIPYRTLPPPRMVRGRCRTPAARSPPEAPSLLLSLGIAPCAISFPVRKAILGCLRLYRDECSPTFFRPLGALIA